MENLVYKIEEEGILLDDYYDIAVVKELVIFDEWLIDKGGLGNWARQQLRNKKWKKNIEKNKVKQWTRLSKI